MHAQQTGYEVLKLLTFSFLNIVQDVSIDICFSALNIPTKNAYKFMQMKSVVVMITCQVSLFCLRLLSRRPGIQDHQCHNLLVRRSRLILPPTLGRLHRGDQLAGQSLLIEEVDFLSSLLQGMKKLCPCLCLLKLWQVARQHA